MDSELVSDSLFPSEENEHKKVRSPSSTYTEQFYEEFPYYLSIGMTYDQFWNDDPWLCKYYREAEELRNEKKNQELWLQGLYIYEALCDVTPVLHAFAKKGVKPHPFSDAPYAITKKQRDKKEKNTEKQVFDKGMMFMEKLMKQNNQKFEEVK